MLADARILAPMVDGVICSFRATSTARETIEKSVSSLHRLGARTIGLTLIGVNPRHDGYSAAREAISNYARTAESKA